MTGSNLSDPTLETYNRAAKGYAEKFAGVGNRVAHINAAFKASGKENPAVLEIGCGDGRDALEICRLTKQYLGIDPAKEMIVLAREKVPTGRFNVVGVEEFSFTEPIDIIFAFASLLHVDKETFASTLEKALQVLTEGGVFYISLKKGDYQGPRVVTDKFGDRTFYYYQASDVLDIAKGYEVLSSREETIGSTGWVEIMLKKN